MEKTTPLQEVPPCLQRILRRHDLQPHLLDRPEVVLCILGLPLRVVLHDVISQRLVQIKCLGLLAMDREHHVDGDRRGRHG